MPIEIVTPVPEAEYPGFFPDAIRVRRAGGMGSSPCFRRRGVELGVRPYPQSLPYFVIPGKFGKSWMLSLLSSLLSPDPQKGNQTNPDKTKQHSYKISVLTLRT
jgi:hypothetical protein